MLKWSANLVGLNARESRLVLKVLLCVFTFLVALALAGSFVPYERVLSEGHPWLPHHQCPGCIFCGMTRSFCALSSGHWHAALSWNRGGPWLYAGSWLWLAAAAVISLRGAKNKLGSSRSAAHVGRKVRSRV
jgi:hypothetical protein